MSAGICCQRHCGEGRKCDGVLGSCDKGRTGWHTDALSIFRIRSRAKQRGAVGSSEWLADWLSKPHVLVPSVPHRILVPGAENAKLSTEHSSLRSHEAIQTCQSKSGISN